MASNSFPLSSDHGAMAIGCTYRPPETRKSMGPSIPAMDWTSALPESHLKRKHANFKPRNGSCADPQH